MGSLLDSGLADLGQSIGGAGTGGIAGFVQGLQLKQQMQKQALEELQMQRALKNPHITALAHGAYLVQDPVTGDIKFNQAPGSLPGGHQAFAINKFLANPTDPTNIRLMEFITGHSPALLEAKTGTEQERGFKERQHGNLYQTQDEEFPTTAEERRNLLQARADAARAGADLSTAKIDTEGTKQDVNAATEARTRAITQPDVNVRTELAKRNKEQAARIRKQIENDEQLTPARKALLEKRAAAAEAQARKHSEAAAKTKKESENTVTIGVDALGRSYMKPTFKKPEDSKAFMSTYQQWTQPLKNLDIGMLDFESKAKKLSTIRKTWIEKNHPNEAEIAGFDQAMREAQ